MLLPLLFRRLVNASFSVLFLYPVQGYIACWCRPGAVITFSLQSTGNRKGAECRALGSIPFDTRTSTDFSANLAHPVDQTTVERLLTELQDHEQQ
jgi:hypothetical protein